MIFSFLLLRDLRHISNCKPWVNPVCRRQSSFLRTASGRYSLDTGSSDINRRPDYRGPNRYRSCNHGHRCIGNRHHRTTA